MNRFRALLCAGKLALSARAVRGSLAIIATAALTMMATIAVSALTMTAAAADNAPATPESRIEARSATLLAVGIVHDDRMAIHLSRLNDNAPVRDAVVTVVLRGVVHPTTAEADGSYTLESKDLRLPGSAVVVFQVAAGGKTAEDLKGMLQVTGNSGKPEEPNNARQLWWWVLNFAVCIGFLMLISRRRKAAAANED